MGKDQREIEVTEGTVFLVEKKWVKGRIGSISIRKRKVQGITIDICPF